MAINASSTESLITPEHFAEVLCEDMQFPAQQFAPLIAKNIREQIQDYHLPVLSTTMPPPEDQDPVVPEEGRPSQELRILIKVAYGFNASPFHGPSPFVSCT